MCAAPAGTSMKEILPCAKDISNPNNLKPEQVQGVAGMFKRGQYQAGAAAESSKPGISGM